MGSRSASGGEVGGARRRSTSKTAGPSRSGFALISNGRHRGDARSDRARLFRRAVVIFVDSNVPMYLVGSPHPNKIAAEQTLAGLIARQEKLVSDVEVLQEILHRYAAIARLDAIQPAFDAVLGVVDEIFP